jgi:hypothetical protein
MPHFVGFGSVKRYVKIVFVGKKSYFSILFGFPLEMCKINKKKAKILVFLFLAIHLTSPLKMLL